MSRRDGITARRGSRRFTTVGSGAVEPCRDTRRWGMYTVIIAFFSDEVKVNIFRNIGGRLAC
jgi:hypothetical protein